MDGSGAPLSKSKQCITKLQEEKAVLVKRVSRLEEQLKASQELVGKLKGQVPKSALQPILAGKATPQDVRLQLIADITAGEGRLKGYPPNVRQFACDIFFVSPKTL